jgi:glycosyltransferase involved in cell wall biosynthesis
MTKLVSIILPLYNTEKYIKETIHSVINQTNNRWELIIIDDGSTDSSPELVKPFLTNKNISYYYQQNSGVSIARNHGIEKAQGDYIALLDADDIWQPTNLEKKIKLLENEDVDFVFSDVELIDENSHSKNIFLQGTDEEILMHYLLWDKTVIPGPCSNLVVKKKCLDNGIRFDDTFSTAADQDFCFNLASKYKGKRIAEKLWKYRILANSMSKNIKIMEIDHIGVYKKANANNLFPSFVLNKKVFLIYI